MSKISKRKVHEQALEPLATINIAPLAHAKLAHTIKQSASCSGLSRSAIYEALKEGRLHARKAGRRTLIEDAELRRFIRNLPVMGATR